jgi:hypothetical protein
MIEGMIQGVEYSSSASKLFWLCKKDGRLIKPDSAPTMIIYDASGESIVSSASMTAVTVATNGGRGFFDFDAQTAAFTNGAKLTGGTSGATAIIDRIYDAGTTGTLTLSDITGTFANDETITDTGSGSATANLAAYNCEYYYSVNASTTTTFELGEDYCMKVTYVISSITYHDWVYFDVVLHTFNEPIITSERVDLDTPDLKRIHPDGENALWDEHIKMAHAELARRIRLLGNRPAFMVKREELFPYELAFTKMLIAENLTKMSMEERKYWRDQAEKLWASRGEFAYDTEQEDSEIDEDVKVLSSHFTR